ncbi:MAG: gamma-glutamyl-gamma-aminobutyrate hydrolase family protein [Bacteroidales bacterium]|nr:gamma-glutamyl-gamma-aminobutyrate hydrolase family protein [Bacteroidales bacterium]
MAVSVGQPHDKYMYYYSWIRSADTSVRFIEMSGHGLDSALLLLERCSGLLLTGGADLHPAFYGRGSDTGYCEVVPWRDTLEFALLEKALNLGMPVLGICRGLQLINVALGGSLYADIPAQMNSPETHRIPETYDCYHPLIMEGTMNFFGTRAGDTLEVNTNHHQGIRDLAPPLMSLAHTRDHLIEAITWKSGTDKPFLLAVQWHPERMAFHHPMSASVARIFTEQVSKHFQSANSGQGGKNAQIP